MKSRAILILAAATLVGLCLSPAAAAPLAEKLPSGSLAYVGWAGRNLTFDGSMFGQLLSDPVVGKIFAALRSATDEHTHGEEERKALAHAWEMGKLAWQHPMAAALVELRQGRREPIPVGAMVMDLGKNCDAFAKHVDAIIELAKGDVEFTEATAKDAAGKAVRYRTFVPEPGLTVAIGRMGNMMFATIGDGAAKQVIGLAAGKGLADDARFKQCMGQMGGKDLQLAYYVDVKGLIARVKQLLPKDEGNPGPGDMVEKITAAVGLGKVTEVAGAIRVVERGMYTKARIFSEAPHKGALMLFAGQPLTDADLAGVPADADILGAYKLSPEAVYAELRNVIKGIEPNAEQELAEGVAQFGDQFGVSLEKDILANLGDTWVLSSAPSQGGFLTGTVLSVQVKDAAKLQAALNRIQTRILPPPEQPAPGERRPDGPTVETIKVGRTEIRYLAASGEFMPVAPAWAVHKDRLYVAAFPQVIQTILAGGKVKPITQDAAFRKARMTITGKPSGLFYVNTPKITRQLYHWALVGWTLAANALPDEIGIRTKPAWLPPLSSIEKYLWPQIATVSSDEKGISFEGHGSLPMLLVSSPMSGVSMATLFVPTFRRAGHQADTAVEMNELKMLTRALMMYEVDQGRYPATLRDPKLGEYVGGKTMMAKVNSGQYVYVAPAKGRRPSGRAILLYRPPGPKGPDVVVAFADGSVQQMSWPGFERKLKAQLDGGTTTVERPVTRTRTTIRR